jgi:sodium transport system ATP-binding protein
MLFYIISIIFTFFTKSLNLDSIYAKVVKTIHLAITVIEVRGLTKVFKNRVRAVDNANFSVQRGEIVGLLGENGAGKTTTLRMIATLLKPTAGTSLINSYDIITHPEKVRSQIGILLGGETGLYDRLTARENIRYFAELNSLQREHTAQEIEKLSKMLGMEEYIDKRVGKFSHGMKQKTAIARSIIHAPPVMLLDEPTAGLDVSSSIIVQDFILNCKKENRAILFSSHKIEEIEKLCDRVVIIHRGKILDDAGISELEEKYDGDLKHTFLRLIGEDR